MVHHTERQPRNQVPVFLRDQQIWPLPFSPQVQLDIYLLPIQQTNKKKEVGNKKNELINSCKDEICNIACEMFRTQNSKHTQMRNMIYGDNKYFLIKMSTIWGITYKRMTKISSQLTLISVQRSSMKLAEICIKKTKSNVKFLN